MKIIGAGLTGLLCGVLNPGSSVLEAGPEDKINHKAVLRMRTPEIAKLTGIPFNKVMVHKAIWYGGIEVEPTPRIIHMYSKKVSGTISNRSIFNTKSEERFIPPDNFVELLKEKCGIAYNCKVVYEDSKFFWKADHGSAPIRDEPIISTIPMPHLAKMLGIHHGMKFESSAICINQFEIDYCDSYATIYYPDTSTSIYRATLNGSRLIVESMRPPNNVEMLTVFDSFGIGSNFAERTVMDHYQVFGKIIPIDKSKREDFILAMTLEFGIYSLGRFATWRPKLMLDSVLEDIFVIRRLINSGNYSAIQHKQED